MLSLLLLSSFYLASSEVYFKEYFDSTWKRTWVHTSSFETAKFVLSPGWWYVDKSDKGLLCRNSTSNYAISAKFPSFSTNSKPLVIQYTLRNHQDLECGGGYIKILNNKFESSSFDGSTPYLIMFGPDICANIYKCHIILPYNNENYSVNKQIEIPNDRATHQYTLILNPDFTVKVLIDNNEVFSGSMKEDFDIPQIVEDKFEIEDIGGIGIEILQTSPGSLFDNIFITDSVEEAKKFSEETFEWKIQLEEEKLKEFDEQQEKIRTDYNEKHKHMFQSNPKTVDDAEIEKLQEKLSKMGPGEHYF